MCVQRKAAARIAPLAYNEEAHVRSISLPASRSSATGRVVGRISPSSRRAIECCCRRELQFGRRREGKSPCSEFAANLVFCCCRVRAAVDIRPSRRASWTTGFGFDFVSVFYDQFDPQNLALAPHSAKTVIDRCSFVATASADAIRSQNLKVSDKAKQFFASKPGLVSNLSCLS